MSSPRPQNDHPVGDGIRILIADDHPQVRSALRRLLSRDPALQVVGEAIDGEQAVEEASILKPDVVIMDVSMPRLDGIQAVNRIKSEHPSIAILGLSMHDDRPGVADMMRRAGAAALMPKSSPSEAIRAEVWRLGKGAC